MVQTDEQLIQTPCLSRTSYNFYKNYRLFLHKAVGGVTFLLNLLKYNNIEMSLQIDF